MLFCRTQIISRRAAGQLARIRVLPTILFTVFFIVTTTAVANATTFIVTKTADTNDGVCDADCSLREAIAAANSAGSADQIEFGPIFASPQTIVLGTNLTIAELTTLTINGPGNTLLTISGNNTTRVFFNDVATTTINNLRIENGRVTANNDGAGIVNQVGTLTLNNVIFANNVSDSEGGAIYNVTGNLTITGSTFTGNSATVEGGAIDSDTFTTTIPIVTISNSTFTGNSATNSGGGAISGSYTLTVSDSTFTDNSAPFAGAVVGGSFNNVTFSNNTAQTLYAGAIYAPTSIVNSTFTNNFASQRGGAVFYSEFGPSANIDNCTFTMNAAGQDGGAIYNFRRTLTVANSRFISNNSGRDGGAFYHDNAFSQTMFTNSIFTNNLAGRDGGGIYNGSGTINISGSTIANNNAVANGGEGGGGIYCVVATLNVTNSTITANVTSGRGGGILNRGTSTLVSTTVNANSATQNAGGLFNFTTVTLTLKNALVGDNATSMGTAADVSGTITSQGYNLIENTSGATITGITAGNILGVDPQLAPLRINGGSTPTVALQPGSPAIDSGNPSDFPSTDQRGILRAQDGDIDGTILPDIGAYERKVTITSVTKTADTNDGTCDSDCSLREALATLNATTSPDIAVLFDGNVFGSPQVIALTMGQLTIPNVGTVLIRGPGAGLVTVSGSNLSRVILIDTGGVALIEKIAVSDGNDTASSGSNGGGGIRNQGILVITDTTISNNHAANFAGGLYSVFGSKTTAARLLISGNSASTGGGLFNNAGIFAITNSVVTQNTSTFTGGGIGTSGSTFSADRITVTNNTAMGGGGISNDSNTVIQNSVISGNHAIGTGGAFGGGGIHNDEKMTLMNVTIRNNTSSLVGAGIYNPGASSTTLTISNSTISGNVATKNGGGIYNGAILTITNSTVSNNSVSSTAGSTEGFGGGFHNDWTATLTNVTVSNNTAGFSGGGVRNFSTFNARNTIFANNTANNSAPDFQGTLASQGYNLLENQNGTTITGVTTGNIIGQDPVLGELASNGGPTQTRMLLPGSPAIDAADPANVLSTDQRGVTRPKDGDRNGSAVADIGAVERDPVLDSVLFDFDGDGKADIGIFRPIAGASEWWINRSSTGQTLALQFGSSSDRIAPADYTGDGKSDIAFFRPASGEWYVLRSEDFSFFALPFGTNGDVPVPADYDADGKSDFAVFRPSSSTWFISQSSGAPTRIEQFGIAGDQPVAADYDGDGKADVGIFRMNGGVGEWWVNRSTMGSLAVQFGASTDKPVQGDYTGDGKTDIAIWRPSSGEWFIVRSEDSSFYGFPFGGSGDVVAPGDYDGDGKFDPTVFRPSSATWFIARTTAGTQIVQFGATGDRPIPNAFVP